MMKVRCCGKPNFYEVLLDVKGVAPVVVDVRRGTINVPSMARLSPSDAREVGLCLLSAAVFVELGGTGECVSAIVL